MGYYKVMLVDDEEEVRQAIAKRVDWEAIGFQVVASESQLPPNPLALQSPA